MKYVIMFTFDPELDAQVPADRMQDLYGRANQWYGDNAAQIGFGDGSCSCVEYIAERKRRSACADVRGCIIKADRAAEPLRPRRALEHRTG